MSNTIQKSLVALIILLVISVAAAGFTLFEKMAVEKQNEELRGQVAEYTATTEAQSKQIKDFEKQVVGLRKDIETKTFEKETVDRRLTEAERVSKGLTDDVARLKREKETADLRIKDMVSGRDDLMDQIEKLKNRPAQEKIVEKIVYRDKPAGEQGEASEEGMKTIAVESKTNEDYWAGIMRAKTALQMELDQIKKDLVATQMKVADFQKTNSDLEIEIGRLKNEKDEIVRKIKYGEDLADNLSVELARSRNDQKAVQDRADKVSQENQGLRSEIKQLTTTKVSLEKSISRLSEEKEVTARKLVETESIIQSRIDEIWKMKKDIDNRISLPGTKGSADVELPPIVVNSSGARPAIMAGAMSADQGARKSGSVVSVNVDNNFVITNLGERAGVRLGDQFRVYRGGSQIGLVQVIQVRQDISAADIKQKTAAFKPGDTVK